MRNLHFPVLQLHGILYIIERRGIHLIFAKNKRIFFLKLSLPWLARSCENGPYRPTLSKLCINSSSENRSTPILNWSLAITCRNKFPFVFPSHTLKSYPTRNWDLWNQILVQNKGEHVTIFATTEARLAQSVEHGTLNPRVVGSSPTLG